MTDEIPHYRFKDDYDLEQYIESRKLVSAALKSEAEGMTIRAKQIDEECRKLENALIPVEESDDE